ncbi:hypothetical protein UFOVP1290_295 [uncultured Caudovirales phage]|uniref:DUF6900 domain-containing protein n=1 Tax=uncultured Caudovirales phage TaxID=2100421 RepID=A0A6J5RWZ3_9CAUD|nr:hypothetical protein UFOVP1290_295 [uncultured Caudovirales phage]
MKNKISKTEFINQLVCFGEELISEQKESEQRESETDNKIEEIAKNILGIDTLCCRLSDRLDFHELAVWDIKTALVAAYNSGYQNAFGKKNVNSSKLCVCGIYPCDRHHPDEYALQQQEERLAYNGKDFR